MSVPKITGVQLSNPSAGPLLLLGNSIGTSGTALWSASAGFLGERFHVVGWDLPGHGRNTDPVSDGFSMAELAAGVMAFADRVLTDRGEPGGRLYYAGDSLGGAVGLQALLDAPNRIVAAVLLCTGAKIGDAAGWHERAARVRESGIAVVINQSVERWFAPGFLEREPGVASQLLESLRAADAEAYALACEALADFDIRSRLGEIAVPVLAVAGAEDFATPPELLTEIANGVQRGELQILDGVAHLAPAEAPQEVAKLIMKHADADGPGGVRGGRPPRHQHSSGPDRYAAGMRVRRAVLGDDHVDRATAAATDFTRDFQQLITEYAWGTIWTRPGLDRRSRSMITLTALVARGHHEELAMHVRAARRNGLSVDEIKEVLLQTAIYCGVPDANTAFRIAQAALADEETTDAEEAR
jgi:3-oxoadipate enol-lactonase / 4-carboxymuconolactone decarboxylase